MKWIKRLLLVFAVLLAGVMLFAGGSWFLFRGTPEWYHPDDITPENRAAAAERAERRFLETINWASTLQNPQIRGGTTQLSTTMPLTPEPRTISFTDVELNAFFAKWAGFHKLEQKYERYLSDPVIVLRDGRLIVAGTMKDFGGAVASLHFEPQIDEQGLLQMNLVRVLAGRLPMPEGVWDTQREKLLNLLQSRLPGLQKEAVMEPNGASNGKAVIAAMTKMLLNVMNDQPASAVVFIPDSDWRGVPVKLTAVDITDNTLTLTIKPLTSGQRDEFLQSIREPYGTETARQ